MDGIGLELWNKKLLQCRYKRRVDFRACAELSFAGRAYNSEPLASVLFQAGADNLDLMVLYWKETFQGSWQRQKPRQPNQAAEQARGDIETVLTTEQKQIENEVQSLGQGRSLTWKTEELEAGKAHLSSRVSLLNASCAAQIADVRVIRLEELEREAAQKRERFKERWMTWGILIASIFISTLSGVWLGAKIDADRSKADRLFVDERISRLMEGQRRTQTQLSDLHSSNRKIAVLTAKSSTQRAIEEANEQLKIEIQDIKDEMTRKIEMMESVYSRAGHAGTEIEDRRRNLLTLQDKRIEEARERTRKRIEDLQSSAH